ncbi:MAG: uracil-DNA glycosylase family protein [Candidatus Promineifilaceae bacterium]
MHSLIELQEEMRACRRCLASGFEIVPGAIFSGGAAAKVMIIGQAPGVTEVEAQRPFNAGSGKRLFGWLKQAGWEETQFRNQQYMTAVTKCYPGKSSNGRGDRVPTRAEQRLCRPFLERELALVDPRLVIPVGGLAIRLFFENGARLKDVIGTAAYVPSETQVGSAAIELTRAEQRREFDAALPMAGRWIVPLPHPSGASTWPNLPGNRALIERAIGLLAEIRQAWDL